MNNNEVFKSFGDHETLKKKKNSKVTIFVILILLILILIFVIYLLCKTFIFGDEEKVNYLNAFEVRGYELNEPFRENVYEYSVDVSEDIVQLICDVDGNVLGCNESISLKNVDLYVHKIILKNRAKEQIYTIKINKTINENDKLRITSIEGNPLEWTNEDVLIKVNALSSEGIQGYSFDGGNTWQESNEKKIFENQILNVIVKDNKGNVTETKEITIDRIDKEKPTVEIVKDKVTKDKIVLKVLAEDILSGIDGISFNNSEFEYNDSFIVKKAGTYTVLAKDKAGNISDKISINIKESDFSPDSDVSEKILTATFDYNYPGTSKRMVSCKARNDSCEITVPIITRYGYEILGWSTDRNATSSMYSGLQKITLKGNTTFYAITKKTVTLTLDKNGASTIGSNNISCDVYNYSTKCKVKLPEITRENGIVIGWSDDKDAKTASYNIGDYVVLSKNIRYYAITKKLLSINFSLNGADSIGSSKESCFVFNDKYSCNITSPKIKRNGWQILGWSTNKDATKEMYKSGEIISINQNISYYAITKKKLTLTLDKNGASTIGSNNVSCDVYNYSTKCKVKLPEIKRENGSVLGWSSNKDSKTASYNIGDYVVLDKDAIYYAITKKILNLTLDKNGASTIGSNNVSCDVYNSSSKCNVKLPEIRRENGSVIGWSSNKDSKISDYNAGDNVEIDKDETYYAITRKQVSVNFYSNGADNIIGSNKKCFVYNNESGCNVSSPVIKRNGWHILGWSTNSNATNGTYESGGTIFVNQDTSYYAITKKIVTITFDSNVGTRSCNIFNNNTSCSITLPTFTKTGSYNGAWGENASDAEPTYVVGKTLEVSKNMSLYGSIKTPYKPAVENNHTKVRNFGIQRTFNIGNTVFEYENGIPQSAVTEHINLLNRIKTIFPFIFVPGKVFVLQYDTYEQYSSYYGLTISFGSYMFIDLKYDSEGIVVDNAIDDNATIHELAHAWDNYYSYRTGNGRIAYQPDFKEFYNTIYPKLSIGSSGNPLSITETFAAMVTNYYWHILGNDSSKSYYALRSGYTLSDSEKNQLKIIIDKYMRISNNNYK